jgi:hypothetical protein
VEEDEDGDSLPDEQEVPSKDGDDFDDIPATHMADDEYEEYVAAEFDAEGKEKGAPPVTAILLGLIAAILLVWWLVAG